MAIGKIDTVGSFFVGQGDIIVFDKPADYAQLSYQLWLVLSL